MFTLCDRTLSSYCVFTQRIHAEYLHFVCLTLCCAVCLTLCCAVCLTLCCAMCLTLCCAVCLTLCRVFRRHGGALHHVATDAAPAWRGARQGGVAVRAHARAPVRHRGPGQLRAVRAQPVRTRAGGVRRRVPHRGRRGVGRHRQHAAVQHRSLPAAARLRAPRARAGAARAGRSQPRARPRHAPGRRRRPLGVRAESLARARASGARGPAGGAQRALRRGARRRVAPLQRGAARRRHREAAGGSAPVVVRQAAAARAAGGRRARLREHDARAADAHQPAALRGLRRLPRASARHVPAGRRRTHAVRTAAGQREARLQGQEEADAAR